MGSGNSDSDGSAGRDAWPSGTRSAAIAEVHGVLCGVAWNAHWRCAKCEFPAGAVGRCRFCAGAGGNHGAALEWIGGFKKNSETDDERGAGGSRFTAGQRIGRGLLERPRAGEVFEHVRRVESSSMEWWILCVRPDGKRSHAGEIAVAGGNERW